MVLINSNRSFKLFQINIIIKSLTQSYLIGQLNPSFYLTFLKLSKVNINNDPVNNRIAISIHNKRFITKYFITMLKIKIHTPKTKATNILLLLSKVIISPHL